MAVFEIAPAKVLQGAVRLQGSASLPTPETQVRVACALAACDSRHSARIAPTTLSSLFDLLTAISLSLEVVKTR
jgi:hypothetical protein